jgi:hypothetical protein
MLKMPISNGEFIDKFTILKIKLSKMSGEKLQNVKKEYDLLYPYMIKIGITEKHDLFKELYNINTILWEYQDWQRVCFNIKDTNTDINKLFKDFDIKSFERIRNEPIYNDTRAKIKKEINNITSSKITEEKTFTSYTF